MSMGAMQVGPNGETFDQLALARYPSAKKIEHVHHAGNSSGIVDGAAVVLLSSADYAKAHGLRPRARIVATATAGAEPVIMLTAPTPASERALAKAGMRAGDIDLWEINEAFAVVPLNTIRRLDLDPTFSIGVQRGLHGRRDEARRARGHRAVQASPDKSARRSHSAANASTTSPPSCATVTRSSSRTTCNAMSRCRGRRRRWASIT